MRPKNLSGLFRRSLLHRLRGRAGRGLLALALVSAGGSHADTGLTSDLVAMWESSGLGGTLGFSVLSLREGNPLAQWNADESFTPASTLKILVTAAALDALPANAYPHTVFELAGRLDKGIFRGALVVRGGGDPNVSDRFFPHELAALEEMADGLKTLGVDSIHGRIVLDDSKFTGPRRPPEWKPGHFDRWYGAEISAVTFNDNCYLLRVRPGDSLFAQVTAAAEPPIGYAHIRNQAISMPGASTRIQVHMHPKANLAIVSGNIGRDAGEMTEYLPVRNPPAYFREALLRALANRGIAFGEGRPAGTSAVYRRLVLTTAPIINVIEEVNQRSQNLHAEILLRLLGEEKNAEGTAAAGLAAEAEFLRRMGLDPAGFQAVDGSGLSHLNRVKPAAMTALLAAMAGHERGRDFVASLATPGVHGTRATRLKEYRGLLKIKSGYINGVEGLCGYAFAADKDTLAFCFLLNGYSGSHRRGSAFVDSLVARVAQWGNLERPSLDRARGLLAGAGSPSGYHDRLKHFAYRLVGTPYALGPTGEGSRGRVEPKPLVDLYRFDCVTYIESVMGLALVHSVDSLLAAMARIRYFDHPPRYETRKHFFVEDWIDKSPELVRPLRFPGDTTLFRTTGKQRFFRAKGLAAPSEDPLTPLSFLPYEKALEAAADWKFGPLFVGVGFISELDWLWISHTGILDATQQGNPMLLHASSAEGRVTAVSFQDYLRQRRGKCPGVMFFEFVDPAASAIEAGQPAPPLGGE